MAIPPDIQVTQSTASTSMGNAINPLFPKDTFDNREMNENKYGYQTLRYPGDVESDVLGYHIKFHVLINVKSKYAKEASYGSAEEGATFQERAAKTQTFAEMVKSGDTVRFIDEYAGKRDPLTSLANGRATGVPTTIYDALFRRNVLRSSQCISLYMPDNLTWNFGNTWADHNPGTSPAGIALSLMNTAGTAIGKGVEDAQSGKLNIMDGPMLKKYLTDLGAKVGAGASGTANIAEALGNISGNQALGLATAGLALNPSIEVLYSGPGLRSFVFDFVFAPRNPKEAETAIVIIQMFKFHSAPEIWGEESLGRYYVPPSEFDIEFHGPKGEMWQLGKIIPHSVLTNVNVNYGHSGQFSVFADGTPTNIHMQLTFKETAFITKEYVAQGY